jgi:hypothetical protein
MVFDSSNQNLRQTWPILSLHSMIHWNRCRRWRPVPVHVDRVATPHPRPRRLDQRQRLASLDYYGSALLVFLVYCWMLQDFHPTWPFQRATRMISFMVEGKRSKQHSLPLLPQQCQFQHQRQPEAKSFCSSLLQHRVPPYRWHDRIAIHPFHSLRALTLRAGEVDTDEDDNENEYDSDQDDNDESVVDNIINGDDDDANDNGEAKKSSNETDHAIDLDDDDEDDESDEDETGERSSEFTENEIIGQGKTAAESKSLSLPLKSIGSTSNSDLNHPMYDNLLIMSPMASMIATFAVMMLSRRIDLFSVRVVRTARYVWL